MSLYKSLSVAERAKIHRLYKKVNPNMSYRDIISDFDKEESIPKYGNGGETNPWQVNIKLQEEEKKKQPQFTPMTPSQFIQKPVGSETTDRGRIIPQQTNPVIDRELKAQEDLQSMDEPTFREIYGTSKHRYQYNNNPDYKAKVDSEIPERVKATGGVDYSSTNIQSKDFAGTPNMAFARNSNLTAEGKRDAELYHSDIISAALPIPGLNAVGKVPGLLDSGLKATGKLLTTQTPLKEGIKSSKNLEDLMYAKKKFSSKYDFPKNLERISQSDKLTDMTIRGLVNRDNTFVRGVSTNWDKIKEVNPEILKHLESKGIDYANNPKAAAEYMATHIPGNTGYGRYGLKEGENAIYVSNSYPTAEGYTYGDGYKVKVKRPTDFSSANRKEWIDSNSINPYKDFKNSPYGTGIVKNDYVKRVPTNFRDLLAGTGDANKMQNYLNKLSKKEEIYNELAQTSWRNHNNKISDLKYKTDKSYRNNLWEPEGPFKREVPNFLDKMHMKYLKTSKNMSQSYYNTLPVVDLTREILKDTDVWKSTAKNLFGKPSPFSHYAIKGEPGQKVLEALNFKRVLPEVWDNTSRGHINKYSKGLSAASVVGAVSSQALQEKAYGGYIDWTKTYK
jgi:hypothetical protein